MSPNLSLHVTEVLVVAVRVNDGNEVAADQ